MGHLSLEYFCPKQGFLDTGLPRKETLSWYISGTVPCASGKASGGEERDCSLVPPPPLLSTTQLPVLPSPGIGSPYMQASDHVAIRGFSGAKDRTSK